MNKFKFIVLTFCLLTAAAFQSASAQTSAFNYQGKLTDGVTAATGTYQMTFALFDAASGGAQIGSTVTNNSVAVANGVFTVALDFGTSPFSAGADRWLEVSVKKPAEGSFTLLTPRQQITSSPYALRTLSATSADSLSAACSGCVTDAKVANGISYSKLTGAPTSLPPSGAASGSLTGTYPSPSIASSSIASAQIVDGSITGSDIGAATITTSHIVDGTITNTDISGTAAISTSKISGLGSLATVTPTGTANTTTFLRGDNTWATPSVSGGGPTVELVAFKNAVQTLPAGGNAVVPDDINFQTATTTPTIGTWDGTTYTAGATGNYLITVAAVQTTANISSLYPQLLVNGTTVVYGVGGQNGFLPTGTFGRGTLTAVVQLTAGQQVKIKIANSNTSAAVTMTADSSTRISIVKF